jgi:histone deacetylase 6
LATKQELLRVHTPDHLHRLQLFCSGQVPPSAIPSDTYINQHTLQCAALAAGSAAEVAVQVYQGEASCGAAIIRPPGHHAESNTGVLGADRCWAITEEPAQLMRMQMSCG